MNSATQRLAVAGAAGSIEGALDIPTAASRGLAVLCHPHPQHGGTMENKVVQTMARAFVQLGYRALRFNFRGVGASQGVWDSGIGEIIDAMAVIQAQRGAGEALVLGGFSFGGYVASHAAQRLADSAPAERLVLMAPAVKNFVMAAVPADTLIIHGETDDVVPIADVLAWARAPVMPVIVVPGSGHFFHGQLPLLKQIIVNAWR